jgi:alpha-methylacyl-CoA racemase
MLLSDLGADVIRIDRPGAHGGGPAEVLARGRRSIGVNLKQQGSIDVCLDLLKSWSALAWVRRRVWRPIQRLCMGA